MTQWWWWWWWSGPYDFTPNRSENSDTINFDCIQKASLKQVLVLLANQAPAISRQITLIMTALRQKKKNGKGGRGRTVRGLVAPSLWLIYERVLSCGHREEKKGNRGLRRNRLTGNKALA